MVCHGYHQYSLAAGGTCTCVQTKNKLTAPSCSPHVKSSKQEVWEEWSCYVAEKIRSLLADGDLDGGRRWRVRVRELVHVKSYAPHVDHLVADVECRPCSEL